MTEYLHSVPGRLRVRAKAFRAETPNRGMALRKLRSLEGVSSVRLNQKAASVTVCYDKDVTTPEEVMELIEHCKTECQQYATCKKATTKRSAQTPPVKNEFNVTREVGKIAFNVIVSRGISYSLGAFLGARA